LFNIQQLNLKTPATTLKATGQFSFENDSNLQVDLNSTDANELQTVLISSGLLPEVEAQMETYGLALAGRLVFNGNIRGKVSSPDVNGTFSLASLLINSNELGSVSATVAMNANEIRVTNGQLSEADGGGIQFYLVKPRVGDNNMSLKATLDRANAGTLSTLLASFPGERGSSSGISSLETQADVSGVIKVDGIPNNMIGSADLRLGPGKIAGEQLESMTARATFTGFKRECRECRCSVNCRTYHCKWQLQYRQQGIQLPGQG
jgi:hypothetical protein